MTGKSIISVFCAVSYTKDDGESNVKNVIFNPKSNHWPMNSDDMIDLNTYIYMELNVPAGKFVLLSAFPIEDFIEDFIE